MAAQMKHPVDNVPNQFLLPGHAKSRRLYQRFIDANKNLTRKRAIRFAVIERNHICRTRVAKTGFIEPRHFRFIYELNRQVEILHSQIEKQSIDNAPEK